MTEDEFLKKRFKPYEELLYASDRQKSAGAAIRCLLIGTDFDGRLFRLLPLPDQGYYEEEFWARCEHCDRPAKKRPELKLIEKERSA